MRLLFKQRLFSWFDSYDIYNEDGSVFCTVRGKMAWGHRLEIYDPYERHIATVAEKIMTFLPRFKLFINEQEVGEIVKEFTFFKPSFSVNCNGWRVDGSFWEWDYSILDPNMRCVARIEKQLLNFTDTYVIDVENPNDALMSLMVVLAIDAVKCSQN